MASGRGIVRHSPVDEAADFPVVHRWPAHSAVVEVWVDVTPECDTLLVACDELVGVGVPPLERVENSLVERR